MPSLSYVFRSGSRTTIRVIGAGAACKRGLDGSVQEQGDRVLA